MNPEISPITLESNMALVSYPLVSYPQTTYPRTPSRTRSHNSCKVLA